jgi:hypothetical protein
MKHFFKQVLLACMLVMLAVLPLSASHRLEAQAASTKKTVSSLSKPSTLKIQKYLNRGLIVAWSKVKNADGYEVYMKSETSKVYVKVADTKKLVFQVNKLKANKTYGLAVRAYKKSDDGEIIYSKFRTLESMIYNIAIEEVHGRLFQATTNSTMTVTITGTNKKKVIAAGTSVTVASTSSSSNTTSLVLGKNQSAKILKSKVTYGNLVINTAGYTKQQKELFVNSKGYSSSTNYLIWVSQYTSNTTIFKGSKGKWKVVRSMPCVVGKNGMTPTGVKKILYKSTDVYGDKGLYITGRPGYGVAFHRLMDSNTTGALSLGCIRLGYSDLYYMYDVCDVGTTVVLY